MTLGEKIKEARKQCGLSQEQLAEKLAVSRSAVAKWEANNGLPDVDNLKSLAAMLNVSIDYLLDNGEAIDTGVIREPYNLPDYGKGSKKKRKVLIIVAVLIAAALLVALYFVFAGNKRVELSLEDFKHNGQYQYGEIAWGSSVDQVKEALSDTLEEDAARKPPASTGYTFYKTKTEYRLDGMSTNASVQFHDGTLEALQFSFRFEQNYQVWFDVQVAELTSLYGEPTKKEENASDMFESTLYDWSTDNSTLQIVLLTGENVQPTGVISVGMKQTDGSGA